MLPHARPTPRAVTLVALRCADGPCTGVVVHVSGSAIEETTIDVPHPDDPARRLRYRVVRGPSGLRLLWDTGPLDPDG